MSIIDRFLSFRVPVFHLASMARSGETLLLRSLNSHSRIHVAHNLQQSDNEKEEQLFRYLMQCKATSVRSGNPRLEHLDIRRGQVIVLKQSVWEHQYPFNGFLLARNPVSIYSSLKYYDEPGQQETWLENWPKNTDRMTRWLRTIDSSLVDGFANLSPIDQFCTFYNRRMGQLISTGLPVVFYENFVLDPVSVLRRIVNLLNLRFEDRLCNSHLVYEDGLVGHGNINLGKPINSKSIFKYMNTLSLADFDEINQKTRYVSRQLGYDLGFSEIRILGTSITPETCGFSAQ